MVQELNPDNQTVVIKHQAISNYMDAMTMPFPVKNPADLSGLKRGDQATFQLHVTDNRSWVDHFQKIGTVSLKEDKAPPQLAATPASHPNKPLLDYKFTNELGQAVSFNDFHGQGARHYLFLHALPLA